MSITGILCYEEQVRFDTVKRSDYHGHIMLVYVFFYSGGKRLEQTRHLLAEIDSLSGQENELGAPVCGIFSPDYQILFFEPVKYPGCVGRTFTGGGAYLALGFALLQVQILKQMELFPGEIERLQKPVNIVAYRLGDQVNAAAQVIVMAGGHNSFHYVDQATIHQLTNYVNS